jgi:hypothetical protein
MAKVRIIQNALNGGELSPKLTGRTDIPRYQHGLEACRNAIPLVTGGATRAPGTRRVATAAADDVRMVPLRLTLDGVLTGYVLEFSNLKLRFHKSVLTQVRPGVYRSVGQQIVNGGAAVEVATPYTTAQLPEITYEKTDNVLYLIHPAHHPQQLVRTSDTSWTLADVTFTAYPYLRPPDTKGITLTPSATSGNITVTASADLFVAGHVGVTFQLNGGLIRITAVTDAKHASATVVTTLTPDSDIRTIQDVVTISYTPPAAPDPAVPFNFTVTATADFIETTLTTTNSALPGGVTIEKATTENQLTGTEPDRYWKEQAFSDLRGYPRAVTFSGQRMILAGVRTWPLTILVSKAGDILDFTDGTEDNAGFAYTPSAASSTIHQLVASDKVFVFSFDKELTLVGGSSGITPTSIDIKERSTFGSRSMVRPCIVGNEIMFASASGRRFRVFRYELDSDRYKAPDAAIFAEHFFGAGGRIKEMAYAAEPFSAVWIVTDSGALVSVTIDQDQDVIAWASHGTDGQTLYRSVCEIPDAEGMNQVWFAVRRTINGQTVTTIEHMDDELNTHCAVVGYDAAGKTTWAGFDHFEGATIDLVGDGFAFLDKPVSGGQVELEFPVKALEGGLRYITRIKDLPPEIATTTGTIQGAKMSVNSILVRLYQSKGCTLNGEEIPFREFGDNLLDQPIAAFSGDKIVGTIGWVDAGWNEVNPAQVEIIQDKPFPLTVLAIVKEVSING